MEGVTLEEKIFSISVLKKMEESLYLKKKKTPAIHEDYNYKYKW